MFNSARMTKSDGADASAAVNSTAAPMPREDTLLEAVRRMRILVVDDNPLNALPLVHLLRDAGFLHVETLSSGEQALRRLAEHDYGGAPVDAMLVDIVMPGMDGYALCNALRSNTDWRDIPVIMITAVTDWQEETARLAYAAGANDILFKPARPVELLPRVIAALSLKRERDLRKRRERELEVELAERKVMEARLRYLVAHDELTGLYNRRHLEGVLEDLLPRIATTGGAALLYIDLDQFKVVNDCEGHSAGDRLLIEVTRLLRTHADDDDTLTRIASDEFALLLPRAGRAQALKRSEAIRHALAGFQFKTHEHAYHVGASIGVALADPGEEVGPAEMLARADQACFVAKTRGRNQVHVFDAEDSETRNLHRNARWAPRIRQALAEDRFALAFQPVMRVSDGAIDRYEALVRMVDETGTRIEPGEFIPAAERMGLIHEIDRWVVQRVVDTLAALPEQRRHVGLNVNLSGHAFLDPGLLALVERHLAATGVDAGRIVFEITETAAVANFKQTREMVERLRALGCRIALDDFGAGFNSYTYLKQLPVDILKIDGTFIRNLPSDQVDQALVRSIVDVARTLGKVTVAEFVGDAETGALLRELGVDYAQGYFIGKPVEAVGTEG